jgi:hypothetical protein
MFYSPSTHGFYSQKIHGNNMPLDARPITPERHAELMAEQSHGKMIDTDANGDPVAVDLPPSDEQKWSDYRSAAKTALSATDVTVNRIAEAVSLGYTSWDAPDVVALMGHRRDLRAILSQPQPEIIPDQLPAHPGYPAGT